MGGGMDKRILASDKPAIKKMVVGKNRLMQEGGYVPGCVHDMPPGQFRREMDELAQYLKSAELAKGFEEILMPGDINFREMEQREADGITVDEQTWQQIIDVAKELGVKIS